jgi:hypothetical protein
MNGRWKAVSEYPFDERGFGPSVLISFVRDSGRTTRTAYASRTSDGVIHWHCSEPLPPHSNPDIWFDEALIISTAPLDYTSAIARKVEELTATWPSGDPRTDSSAPSGLAAE